MGGSSPEISEKEQTIMGEEKMATLPQVILGQAVGRPYDREITYFSSEGTGIQFAALGGDCLRKGNGERSG